MKVVFPYDGYESLGIGYLASIAMQNGHKVDLHPVNFGDYIKGYSPRSFKNIEKEKKAILQLKPDLVAFSLNSFMAGAMINLAHSIKQSGTKTIAGGPHCSAEPAVTTESNAFNAVIAGEADNVFLPTIESISKDNYDLPWLFTYANKAADYAFTDDIENLPFPAKKLFYNINSYEADDYKIVTSRGCPYNCIFCSHSIPKINSKFRRRSIENIIKELIFAKQNFRIKSVYFLDDIFTINEDWIRDFVKIYKQKISLPFHAISHPNNVNEKIINFLKEGGCSAIRLGVQTTNEKIKASIGRTDNNQKVIDAINSFKKKSIKVEIDHIVNLPGDSIDEGRKSINFYNALRPDSIKVYWLIPLPGTIWFNQSSEQNLITKEQVFSIKTGLAFGKHSYLYYNKSFNCSKWLGIHFILSYLTILPKAFVSLLIKFKADRYLRIHSFLIIVGLPRFISSFGKWDLVGKEHIRRIFHRIIWKSKYIK